MPIAVPSGVAEVAWSTWLPDLMPHLPGCPNAVARHELLHAAQILLQRSRAWTVTLPDQPVVAAQETVDVDLTGAELVRIERAWYDGVVVPPRLVNEIEEAFGSDWQEHTGTPTAIVQMSPQVVRLYPIPVADAATGLRLRAALRPTESATGIPGDLARRYWEQILAGAKARLMLMPGKPWTNPDMAGVQAGAFDAGVSRAGWDAATGFGRGRIRSRPKWC